MSRPPLEGLVETCLYVTDVGKSRDFYQRVFGFAIIRDEQRICVLDVAPGQVLILCRRGGTLEPVPVGSGFIPAHDGDGQQHVAFGMPQGAVEDWKMHLEGLHIEIESALTWPQGGHSLYFRDPDGLLVELITPGLWPNY